MNINNWHKYILKESENIDYRGPHDTIYPRETIFKFNPNDYSGLWDNNFLTIFNKLWKTNDFFKKRVLTDIIENEIAPFYSKLVDADKRALFKLVKTESDLWSEDWTLGVSLKNRDFNFYYQMLLSESPILDKISQETSYSYQAIFRLLEKFFIPKTELLPGVLDHPRNFVIFYYEFYKKHPEKIPKIVRLTKRTPQHFRYHNNYIIVKKAIQNINNGMPVNFKIVNIKMMKRLIIGNEIGSGAYGRIFLLPQLDRVLKIFSESVDLEKDLERIITVRRQIRAGKANIKDAHYFESGVLAREDNGRRYYFAVMPKLIPIMKEPFYNDEYKYLCASIKFTATQLINKKTPTVDYDEFETLIQRELRTYNYPKILPNMRPGDYEKILQAGWRSYSLWGGKDLHAGNIGYLENGPDNFLYFDM